MPNKPKVKVYGLDPSQPCEAFGVFIDIDAHSPALHDMGGLSLGCITVHDGLKEARFQLRLRIPDDPRGGQEGRPHLRVDAVHRTRNVTHETVGRFMDFNNPRPAFDPETKET